MIEDLDEQVASLTRTVLARANEQGIDYDYIGGSMPSKAASIAATMQETTRVAQLLLV